MKLGSLVLLSAILVGCGGGGGSGGSPTAPPGNPSPNPTSAAVTMRSESGQAGYDDLNYFTPNSVTVSRNGMVTWSNATGIDHNVTFNATAGAPASVSSFTSGSVSRTFATAGTFDYQCTNHTGMVGAVVVQ